VLIDVSHIDIATKILGFDISMPIMIAPSAMHKMAHPEGSTKLAINTPPYVSQAIHSWINLPFMQESLQLQEQQHLQEP
jgi:hypothetical protein